jgi:hypothetical protein
VIYVADLQDLAIPPAQIEIRQGREPPEFAKLLGGRLVLRQVRSRVFPFYVPQPLKLWRFSRVIANIMKSPIRLFTLFGSWANRSS